MGTTQSTPQYSVSIVPSIPNKYCPIFSYTGQEKEHVGVTKEYVEYIRKISQQMSGKQSTFFALSLMISSISYNCGLSSIIHDNELANIVTNNTHTILSIEQILQYICNENLLCRDKEFINFSYTNRLEYVKVQICDLEQYMKIYKNALISFTLHKTLQNKLLSRPSDSCNDDTIVGPLSAFAIDLIYINNEAFITLILPPSVSTDPINLPLRYILPSAFECWGVYWKKTKYRDIGQKKIDLKTIPESSYIPVLL